MINIFDTMKQLPKDNSSLTLARPRKHTMVVEARLWQKGRVPLGAWMLGSILFWGVGALSSPAAASELGPDRPPLPAMSLEDSGALSIWRNPANLGFDPDPSFALLWGRPLGSSTGKEPRTFMLAGTGGPAGLGIAHQSGTDRPDWTNVSASVAIPFGKSFQTGFQLGWQIPEGPDNNFATFDVGTGWRPLAWWGMSLVGYNMGVSGRHTGVKNASQSAQHSAP